MLLNARPSLVSSATKDGNTCAHIAAFKGSSLVVKELMKFDKPVVITSRNKVTESTVLHIAAEGGHRDLVKMLLDAGASPSDETKNGLTPIHIASKNGLGQILNDCASYGINLRRLSMKSGMSALHLAALHGEAETVRELLTHMPSLLKSEVPVSVECSVARELANECDITPLHLASYTGSDDAVRALLNSPDISVDAASSPSGFLAIHFACLGGHVGVIGLLLSRSTDLVKVIRW